ncbi:MAG: PTS sugar transporter subunit IIA [Treponema sp.]|jgi:mannose/fructose/sorbose-specific phosphotransferase system IIA component|nr:PTS sugar transporter subunit IIA [Treponema sp.]
MVGILVVSHGNLAQSMLECVDMLVGVPEQFAGVGIQPGEAPEEFYKNLQEKASGVDSGDGLVALVDLYGGTPNNNVARLSMEKNVRIITGVNLPMVMAAAMERTETSTQADLVEGLLKTGAGEIMEFKMEKK